MKAIQLVMRYLNLSVGSSSGLLRDYRLNYNGVSHHKFHRSHTENRSVGTVFTHTNVYDVNCQHMYTFNSGPRV